MLLNSTPITSALRMATVAVVALSFVQLPAVTATARTHGSSAAQSSDPEPLVFYLGGIPLGFVRGETIRITVSNPDQPRSQASSDGRKFKMLVAPLIVDAQGEVIAQSDEIEIEPGQFRSFDFNRDDLALRGEPGTGRLQVRSQIRYRFFSIVDRTQITPNEFLNTLEVIDNATGQTRVVHSRAIDARIQERVIDGF